MPMSTALSSPVSEELSKKQCMQQQASLWIIGPPDGETRSDTLPQVKGSGRSALPGMGCQPSLRHLVACCNGKVVPAAADGDMIGLHFTCTAKRFWCCNLSYHSMCCQVWKSQTARTLDGITDKHPDRGTMSQRCRNKRLHNLMVHRF